ncbi:uncharacterized protein LOC134874415 isoform X5 [Eleginops maclovinus]
MTASDTTPTQEESKGRKEDNNNNSSRTNNNKNGGKHRKRRFKKRGNEETHPVVDDIQDGFIIQADNESSAGPTAAHCTTDFTDDSNQNDPRYSNIPGEEDRVVTAD